MADPAKKLVRLPRDLAAKVKAETEAQGVSENTWYVAVIAAATGYKLSAAEVERYLRAAKK